MTNPTTSARTSDREFTVTRTFNGPARIVWQAWTTPDLFRRWWTPKSMGMTIVSCEMDVRTGGTYRLMIRHPAAPEPMPFFGRYIESVPHSRLVWTNDEGGEGAGAVTTVTLTEKAGQTHLVMRDLYPSKEALDEAMVSGATGGHDETLAQLDAILATM